MRTLGERALTDAPKGELYDLIENGIWAGKAKGLQTHSPTAMKKFIVSSFFLVSTCFVEEILIIYFNMIDYRRPCIKRSRRVPHILISHCSALDSSSCSFIASWRDQDYSRTPFRAPCYLYPRNISTVALVAAVAVRASERRNQSEGEGMLSGRHNRLSPGVQV